jgi:hypothetical protein
VPAFSGASKSHPWDGRGDAGPSRGPPSSPESQTTPEGRACGVRARGVGQGGDPFAGSGEAEAPSRGRFEAALVALGSDEAGTLSQIGPGP